ncbi:oligosaccharide repeat unit polymerase [Niabella yanshanensis]|uniref:Oligosaccharide repeat unit polymerase n=1 Tax=Niabella yanshanensis TaxID=577386 RepID=A0ABZ0W8T9_9BACT|nr:oligosaccharide repeat unit polymerase [Niabella yanshanensis]WQD39094.1 oligosaccharide repeat unit polymerase [Niabella yanshanensis]
MNFVNNYTDFFVSLIIAMGLAFFFIYKVLGNGGGAMLVTILKFGLFIFYFTFLCHQMPIVLVDDLTYYEGSLIAYDKATSFGYFFSKEGYLEMGALARGMHFGYYIYNVIAMHLFGVSYYAPVLMNVLVSVFGAVLFYKILILAGIDKRFSKFAFLLLLLHWDLMSWSSFINLKDTFVLFLTTAALYNIIKLKRNGFNILNLVFLIVILLVFQIIRFYFSYFIVVTTIVFFLSGYAYRIKSRWKKLVVQGAILIVMPIGFFIIVIKLFSVQLAALGPSPNIVLGIIRYLLTPVPFQVDPAYWFISLATILHWMFIPLTLYGLYLFLRRYFRVLMPFLIMTILLTVFYGSFTELQGPRHRIPLLGFIALLEALGIWNFLMQLTIIRRRRLGTACRK